MATHIPVIIKRSYLLLEETGVPRGNAELFIYKFYQINRTDYTMPQARVEVIYM